MHPLFWIIIFFVAFISISTVVRQHKRRKKDNKPSEPVFQFNSRLTKPERRIKPEVNDYVTKYNSQVDYREPVGKKDDYADWGS